MKGEKRKRNDHFGLEKRLAGIENISLNRWESTVNQTKIETVLNAVPYKGRSESWGGMYAGFHERVNTIFDWTELNKREKLNSLSPR